LDKNRRKTLLKISHFGRIVPRIEKQARREGAEERGGRRVRQPEDLYRGLNKDIVITRNP